MVSIQMRSCGEDTSEIEVKPDGSWRVKGDNECRDLRQWHLPDGSLCLPDEGESKHKPEASKPIKQESTGLKLGIRKNSHGKWEVSKHEEMNTHSSGDRVQGNLENGGRKVIPMSSSATASGRDGEDPSVDQDVNGHFDLSISNGLELDSISLNLDPTFGLTTQNSVATKDAEVIVLSDSDDENAMMANGVIHTNGFMDNSVNYPVDPHGITGSYQDDPGLGVGGTSCLELFNPDAEYGLPLWPLSSTTQGVSNFQLFDSDGSGTDPLANPHLSTVNCPLSMNDYILAPDTAMNPATLMPDSTVDHSSNDLNDGLVDNPLAFCGKDPSLQLFLPTRPSDACGPTDSRNHQDIGNGIRSDDWISLRLGDGGGRSNGDLDSTNGLHNGQQPHSREVMETGLLLFYLQCSFASGVQKTEISSGNYGQMDLGCFPFTLLQEMQIVSVYRDRCF